MRSGSRFPGLHDYAVEYLRKYRPAIRITPGRRSIRWLQFLRLKKLPLTGWDYVFTEEGMNQYDVCLSLTGNDALRLDPPPRSFGGMKVHHVMDFSFRAREAAQLLRSAKTDYLLGYASHDRWCGFFREQFPEYAGKTIPLPFGYSPRFQAITPWDERVAKVAAMGAVNEVKDPASPSDTIVDYAKHFQDTLWAHPMRAAIREQIEELSGIVSNFMAVPPELRNISYDSVAELNRHQFFVNDDSIMHYPPARTYEGTACGAVMVCSDHPVYEQFGWKSGVNCITHRFGDLGAFRAAVEDAIASPERVAGIQKASLENARRFTHSLVADGLHRQLQLLWEGKADVAADFWSV